MESVGKTKLSQKAMVVEDPRFSRLHSDPRFQRAFKRKLKVPIDSRFSHIFSDKRFSDPLALDKRGRKPQKHSHKSSKKGNALQQYYHLRDDNEASPAEDDGNVALQANISESTKNRVNSFPEAHQNAFQNRKTQKHIKKRTKKGTFSGEVMPPHAGLESILQDDRIERWSQDKSDKKPTAFDSEVQHAESDSGGNSLQEEDLESEDGLDEEDASDESSGTSSTSSSSSEDSSDEEDMAISSSKEAEDEKVPTTETETQRLALVYMDWDHIRPVDILAVMNSFLPKGAQILSVSIFPSEFGLQQMQEEDQRGPQGLFQSEDSDEDDNDAEDGVNMKRLRQYEKDKLRYYYAVVECDSVSTAGFLYKSCDGMEFERTSNTLDLRFIPDDMRFLNDPRDVATQVPADYQVPLFETRALQHSKVKLTWDDDEPDRVKSLHQKFNAEQLNDMDFKAYLASDSSDSEIGEDAGDVENTQHEDDTQLDDPETEKTGDRRKGLRDKYRALLLGSEEAYEGKDLSNKDQDLEITFQSGLEELSKRLMDKSKQKGGDETVWEAYLRKKKEKKKLKKQTEHDEDGVDERHVGDDHDAGFDDPFFTSSEGVDFAAAEGIDSESERLAVPVAKQKKGARVQKKAELEEKKREEEKSKAELELLFADELAAGSGAKGYNLKKKLKGKRKAVDMPPEKLPTVNYDDPRFSALFTSHRFAVDPTEPEFKRSAAQLRSLVEKQQKHLKDVHEVVDPEKPKHVKCEDVNATISKKAKLELNSMVRSLKRKVGGVVDM